MIMIHFCFLSKLVDVEMTILHEKLEEEIQMKYPTHMKNVGRNDHHFGKVYQLPGASGKAVQQNAVEIKKR